MLSNAYFLANFRFDTAKNEPAKKSAKILQIEFLPILLILLTLTLTRATGLEAAGTRDGRPERGGARLEGRAVLPLPARLVRLVPSLHLCVLHCRVPQGLGSQKLRNIQLAAFSVSTRIALF